MKKKLIILFALTLVFCVSFTLAACGGETYVAKFNANGGKVILDGKEVDLEFGVSCSVVNEPEATKEGYRLLGWYLDEKFTKEVPSWPYTLTENTVFYAKWEEKTPANVYTVIFESAGGSAVATQKVAVVAEKPVPTWAGHVFVGWFDNYACSGEPVVFPYTVPRDITLYAKWEQGSGYTLYLNPMEGDLIEPLENVKVVYRTDLPTPTKTGSEFECWCTDNACTTPVTFPYTLTEDTTFYAKWKDNTETPETSVIVLVNAGTGITATINGTPVSLAQTQQGLPAIEGETGAKLVLTDPVRTGAEFQGWYTTESFAGEAIKFPYTLSGNDFFYAKWKITATPTVDSIAELTQYFNKTMPENYSAGYGLLIENSVAAIADNYYLNYYIGNNIGSVEYSAETGAWLPAYRDWAFARDDGPEPYWMTYAQNPEGSYEFNGSYYVAEPIEDIEAGFLMVYLARLNELNPAQFAKLGSGADALWYATEDYADEAGNLILGNASGAPDKYQSTYTEFVLRFDSNGVVTSISAKSQVVDTYQIGQGTAATLYYYTHTITLDTSSSSLAEVVAGFPTEDSFYSDISRPSGLYPELNPDDAERNVPTGDRAYTNAELKQALSNLSSFTSYYTLAGNTFSGFVYNPVTILTNGNVGKIVTNAYSYTWGDQTATQGAGKDMFFVYNDELDAFFLIAPNTNNGYDIYCDQYSYKNNYDYNQYLLGISGSGSAITFNCKYPAVSVKYLNADKFTYNAEGKFFEYSDVRTMTAAGKALFGDMDLVYPEAGETENYVYLRVYMNDGKIAKVTAATQVELYGESKELFMKELVITDYSTPSLTLPNGITADSCIAPGEEKVGGSVDALAAAIASTNATGYTYTDKFVFDDEDELGGVYGSDSDTYVHYNGITRILASGGKYYYLYFENGCLRVQHTDSNTSAPIDLTWTSNDVEKANEWLSWAYPISQLISADWFYEGKDGKFYGKSEFMDELSAVIARYSGSENYLESNSVIGFSDSYRWTVQLDFVSVQVSAGKLSGFYYSGVINVVGSSGSHTKPFSGYASFSYDGTTLTLPAGGTPDTTYPALQSYLDAKHNVTVTDLGIVNFTENANAAGYKLYVYDGSTATQPITVIDDFTNGFDLKTVSELGVVATPKTYYVSLQALGDGVTYLDGPLSDRMVVILSTLPKVETPSVSLDNKTGLLIVGESANSESFAWEVKLGSTSVKRDVVSNGNTLDLSSLGIDWQEKKTYTITVYRRPTDANAYRQSDEVSVLYTPPKAQGTYVDELFAPFDFSQSFSLSLTNQGISKNHWFADGTPFGNDIMMGSSGKDFDNASTYRLVFRLWFDAPSQKGKLVFYTYSQHSDLGYSESDVDLHPVHVVFRFTKKGDQLVGSYTKTEMGLTVVDNKNYSMDLLFRGLDNINQDNFVETSGSISDYRGLVYNYGADMENDSALQQTLANFSPLEELLGTTFTYTGLQATVGFNSDGGLCTGNGITLLAKDANDNVIVLKLNVSGVGGNHLPNIIG
ncbi:MAG: InlB B-repeat-containing protein [Corallococcus sp.]|nr:InlB B-repeat-containing protein [Corallococcus sp.]MCM1359569.1 InlB B-repeat-containing protein [Corallococcus sp.]MCM1395161.1 InlB B-repeat-containing protein [Corallococcus sp.]